MKYICVLLVLGSLAYATYAAPARSEIQQDSIDPTDEKEFLDLINRVAKMSQSGEEDNTRAEAQWWGTLIRLIRKPLMNFAGKAIGGLLSKNRNSRRGNGAEANALIQTILNNKLTAEEQQGDDEGKEDIAKAEKEVLIQAFVDKLVARDSDVTAAIENLPEEAREQALFSI